MHILVDSDLRHWGYNGGIDPFEPEHINPASIDICLGGSWIDIEQPNVTRYEPLILYPRCLQVDLWNIFAARFGWGRAPTAVLATTIERMTIRSDEAASVKLKTTPSREGLGHPIADWIDPGFCGQLTLMLHAHKKIELDAGRRVAQLVVYKLDKHCDMPYNLTGHYHGQTGPTRSWRDK